MFHQLGEGTLEVGTRAGIGIGNGESLVAEVGTGLTVRAVAGGQVAIGRGKGQGATAKVAKAALGAGNERTETANHEALGTRIVMLTKETPVVRTSFISIIANPLFPIFGSTSQVLGCWLIEGII